MIKEIINTINVLVEYNEFLLSMNYIRNGPNKERRGGLEDLKKHLKVILRHFGKDPQMLDDKPERTRCSFERRKKEQVNE